MLMLRPMLVDLDPFKMDSQELKVYRNICLQSTSAEIYVCMLMYVT